MVGMLELIPGTTSSHDRHMQTLSVKVEYSTYECLASASGSYLYHRGQPLQKQPPEKRQPAMTVLVFAVYILAI